MTPVAGSIPPFVTTIVKVTFCPTLGVVVLTTLLNDKSEICEGTVTVTGGLGVGSGVLVFVIRATLA